MLCHLVIRGFKIAHIYRLCSNPVFADARSRVYWVRLTLTMLSAISEFERGLISLRTKEKLAQLKADGVRLGRPVKHSDQTLKTKAAELFDRGLSWRKVAGELGVALSTLQRLRKEAPHQ